VIIHSLLFAADLPFFSHTSALALAPLSRHPFLAIVDDETASIAGGDRDFRGRNMIITFKTKAYGDITMLGDDALKLIKIAGHGGTVPGAIAADDLAEAIRRLKAAVAKDTEESAASDSGGDDDAGDRKVGLAQRAFPLIEMFEAALAADAPVMWGN
jgi:hypothetical protein